LHFGELAVLNGLKNSQAFLPLASGCGGVARTQFGAGETKDGDGLVFLGNLSATGLYYSHRLRYFEKRRGIWLSQLLYC
jgi:hypothetical protein